MPSCSWMKMYIGTRELVSELCDPSDKEMCRWVSRLGAVGTSWLAAKVEASRCWLPVPPSELSAYRLRILPGAAILCVCTIIPDTVSMLSWLR